MLEEKIQIQHQILQENQYLIEIIGTILQVKTQKQPLKLVEWCDTSAGSYQFFNSNLGLTLRLQRSMV